MPYTFTVKLALHASRTSAGKHAHNLSYFFVDSQSLLKAVIIYISRGSASPMYPQAQDGSLIPIANSFISYSATPLVLVPLATLYWCNTCRVPHSRYPVTCLTEVVWSIISNMMEATLTIQDENFLRLVKGHEDWSFDSFGSSIEQLDEVGNPGQLEESIPDKCRWQVWTLPVHESTGPVKKGKGVKRGVNNDAQKAARNANKLSMQERVSAHVLKGLDADEVKLVSIIRQLPSKRPSNPQDLRAYATLITKIFTFFNQRLGTHLITKTDLVFILRPRMGTWFDQGLQLDKFLESHPVDDAMCESLRELIELDSEEKEDKIGMGSYLLSMERSLAMDAARNGGDEE